MKTYGVEPTNLGILIVVLFIQESDKLDETLIQKLHVCKILILRPT